MGRFAWQDERTDWEYIQRFLHVSIGVISIPLAGYFVLVLLGMTVMAPTHDASHIYDFTVEMFEAGMIALLLASTAFFGFVGFRLISGRGAKGGGGLLSPMGYRLLGVVLALLAMLVLFAVVSEIAAEGIHVNYVPWVAFLVFLGVLSVRCFVAAARRQCTSSMRKGSA